MPNLYTIRETPGAYQPLILAVDDDPTNLSLVTKTLSEIGYSVIVAEDGLSAVKRADFAKPDLILLDISMPDIDGYETCRRLKQQDSTSNIPIIFMSAKSADENRIQGLETGAVDYVTKPFNHQELLARVNIHLRLREYASILKNFNDLLENKVAQRTAELEKAYADLQHERSERQAMMARLLQANRMTTIGLIASSVAHNINTPNGSIKFAANHLSLAWNDTLPILEKLTEEEGDFVIAGMPFMQAKSSIQMASNTILDNSERINQYVRDLRAYNIGSSKNLSAGISVNGVITSAVTILQAQSQAHNITLQLDLNANLPTIIGNESQLEQVVVNILLNAIQAMTIQGTIIVETDLSPEGGEIRIIIADQGEGIPPEILQHLFEPFLSSKIDQGGSGLGLYISNYIVTDHGGRITVAPAPVKGTIFTVHLPVPV